MKRSFIATLAALWAAHAGAGVIQQGYYELGDADHQPTAGTPAAAVTRDTSLFTRGLTRVDDATTTAGGAKALAVFNGSTADGSTDPSSTFPGVTVSALSLGNTANTSLELQSVATPAVATAPFLRFVLNTTAASLTDETSASNGNSYIAFTLTAKNADILSLTALTLTAERGGTSTPRGFFIRGSADNFATDLVTVANIPSQRPTLTNYSVDLSTPAFQSLSTVTFRIYAFGPATNVSVDFDDITIMGALNGLNASAVTPIVVALAPPQTGPNAFPREGDVYSTQFGPNFGNSAASSTRHYEYDVSGTPAPLITSTDNFGVETYLYLTQSNQGTAIPIFNGNAADTGWGLSIDSLQHLSGVIGTGSSVARFGSSTLPLNQWVHVALVRDAGTAVLYVNGVASGSDSTHTPSFTSTSGRPQSFLIGSNFTDRSSAFSGIIGETRVFTFQPGAFNSGSDLLVVPLGTVAPAPQTPTNLQLTGLTSTSATLAWNLSPGPAQNAAYSAVTSYSVMEVTTVQGSSVYTAVVSGASAGSATISGLATGSIHSWAIQAFDAAGNASAPTPLLTLMVPTPVTATLSSPLRETGGAFSFSASVAANQTALVEASSNLADPNAWQVLQSTMPNTASMIFRDAHAADYPARFYRVIQP